MDTVDAALPKPRLHTLNGGAAELQNRRYFCDALAIMRQQQYPRTVGDPRGDCPARGLLQLRLVFEP